MSFFYILVFTVTVCAFLFQFIKYKTNYWKKNNVPHVKATPILGHYAEYILLKKYIGKVAQEICQKFPNAPYVGAFYGTEPTLVIQDPELLKLIMTKDFYFFNSREIAKYTHKEMTTQNLFFTYGDRWKVLRQNLTPLFTSTKMRNMFHLVENCCRTFENMLDEEVMSNNVIDTRILTARYTMDAIGSCAFGINTKTMEKGSETNPFTVMGDLIFEVSTSRAIKWVSRAIWPSIFYGLGFKNFPVQIDVFFKDMLMNVFQSRQFQPSSRNDFIDLTLGLKSKKVITGDSMKPASSSENKRIELEVGDDVLVSNCVAFFAAGYETSATTLSYTLYELAKDKVAQAEVQKEVDMYLRTHNNKLNFDCVTELVYSDACISEVMRLYPLLGVITREVVDDYTLPTGLRLPKGMRVHVPVYHLHHNPDHFEEPQKFIPERFLNENKSKIKPYTYMPFGEGPRICIGLRFAKMQMLSGLATIMKKFNVELADGMPSTLEFDPRAIITQALGGINLKFIPRDGWEDRVFVK